jgi:hypothetical protein
MKTIKLLSLATIAVLGLTQPTWAGPRGGGGFSGGGSSRGHFGGFAAGGFRAAPVFSGRGAYYTGRSTGGLSGAPRFYYGGARMSGVRSHALTAPTSRSIGPPAGSRATITRQQDRVGSVAARTRVSDPRISRAANRGSFNTNHAFARHDGNWHGNWDKRRAHFDHGHVFVFINGFWYGFYPWDYLPYYGYDYYGYPYDYYGYPYDYSDSDYYPHYDDDQLAYVGSDQYGNNATVSAVQSELAKLGYYRGAIDGVVGDETQAALARYQEDHDLSVTGTLTAATLQSLGLPQAAS